MFTTPGRESSVVMRMTLDEEGGCRSRSSTNTSKCFVALQRFTSLALAGKHADKISSEGPNVV